MVLLGTEIESIEIGFEEMEWGGFWLSRKWKKEMVDGISELDMIAKGRSLTEDEG